MKYAMVTLVLLLATIPVLAQTTVETPQPGSAMRKAILDALREPVEDDLGQPVKFKVDVLRVQNGWAFVRGVPQRPDGGAIDYSTTGFKEEWAQGAFDDGYCALLWKDGKVWRVIAYAI